VDNSAPVQPAQIPLISRGNLFRSTEPLHLKWKKRVLKGLPNLFGDPQTEALKSTHEKEVMALDQEMAN
jgi:hypothetical protein